MALSRVTNALKSRMVDLLSSDFDSAENNYYIAIGRPYPWVGTVPAPDADPAPSLRDVRAGLMSYKIAGNNSAVVGQVSWTLNEFYYPYDDEYSSQSTSFYVVNSNNEVFLCIENGKNSAGSPVPSSVEPTKPATDKIKTFKTSDGYHWRFLYQLSPFAVTQFSSLDYIPVKKVGASPVINEEIEQLILQDSSIRGQVLSVQIIDGGANYTSPTISFTTTGSGNAGAGRDSDENGNPLGFSVVQSGGVITAVKLDSDNSGKIIHGSQITDIKFTITDGGSGAGAIVRPVFPPSLGLNADPRTTLRSDALMIKTEFQDTELGVLLAQNDFRTLALVRNPRIPGGGLFNGNTANAMKIANLSGISGSFNPDEIFTQSSTGAQGYVVALDGTELYYVQNSSTGFADLSLTSITTPSGGLATVASITSPDVDVQTGDLLFVTNHTEDSAIPRSGTQTEDVRLIIQF